MGLLIDAEDFTGRWQIATDCYSETELDAYINKYEDQYLTMLLGVALRDLFVADLTAQVPVTARFTDIFNPFNIDDDNCVRRSEGMKEMLLGLVYFHYVRDQRIKNTVSGNVQNQSELATMHNQSSGMVLRYNEAVDTYCEIQWYIDDNIGTYPEENMQFIEHISGI